MKSDSAESGVIIDFMSQMALAYKNISFRLINNGNVLFSTTGDGKRINTIARVFPNIDIKNLKVDVNEKLMFDIVKASFLMKRKTRLLILCLKRKTKSLLSSLRLSLIQNL